MKKDFEWKKEFKDERLQKTFSLVFDNSTIQTIHSLSMKGFFELLEFPVSSGKEAFVFRASVGKEFRAVKVYKITTSNFNKMSPYLQGDFRFKNVKKEKREIVFAWARKEFKNLELCRKAGVQAPIAFGFLNNALVMEFIGENGEAALTLQKTPIKELNLESIYNQLVENLAKLTWKAELVHADLSPYNMLVSKGKLYFIDLGQAVLLSHPQAKEFFERDLKNLSNYFSKHRVKKTVEELKEDLKKEKEKLSL